MDFMLEPSEDLAYVISVLCGDGHAKAKKGYHYIIYLEAKDREFVEELAIRVGRVLNRPRACLRPLKMRHVDLPRPPRCPRRLLERRSP